MSHYKPYPAYKDSGIEWIGRVPDHWVVGRLRDFVASISTGPFGTALSSKDYVSGGTPVINPSHISPDGCAAEENVTVDAPTAGRLAFWALRPGDIITARRGELGRAAVVRDEQDGWICGTGSLRITPATCKVMSEYIHSTLYADHARSWLDLQAVGSTMPNLSEGLIGDLPVAAPPTLDEQRSLLRAVKAEQRRIDALIEKKTRFIELLKEKRQALITHAVTKGLDPNVTMKDSGVAWIGDVPEYWEVSKLAYTTREAGGKTPDTKNEAYWGGDVPWVSPKDMKQSEIIGAIDTISDTAVKECGMRLFAPGAILAVVRGMILAHSFPVATLAIPATINQDMKALEPDTRIRANYLRLILEAAKDYVVSVLVAEAAHGTRVLRTDVWRQLPALIPPLDEQDAILAELDRITARHEKLTDRVKESIALLKERRSALITAAVTGQIDLREDAA